MEPFAVVTHERDGYVVSTDPARLDLDVVHRFLSEDSYWARGVPRDVVERSVRYALPFGLYHRAPEGEAQVGFARVVTDRATFAYLADVFVLDAHRGRGLGQWLTACVLAHPDLQGLRRILLTTQDAHGLYEKAGFVRAPFPERFMVIDRPDLYTRGR
ncbi:MAG TPA: GNAT family N-acetyltransferase [Rubricoccaceae bacterium]|nr:GNAT family N-acetyltransferase [Rubricoccaceae bacterium]